jgi:hypothetical protein
MKTTYSLACLAAASLALPVLTIAAQSRGGDSRERTSTEAELQRQAQAEQERKQVEIAATYFKVADYDGNNWISFREARTGLEIDRPRFLVYDADQDGQITLDEYTLVSIETYRRYGVFKAPIPNPDDPDAASLLESIDATSGDSTDEELEYIPAEADSVLELFGMMTPRVQRQHTTPEPDQIVGPVFPFRRLDYDGSGAISPDDLNALALGSGLDVRTAALIAAFDLNQDQEVSEEEFLVAMGYAPR